MRAAGPIILSVLRRVPLFADLDDQELELLSERLVRRSFAQGETIFVEGEPCRGLYVVESGTIRVVKTSAQGREQLLGLERAGSALGEISLLDGGGHLASALADSPGSLLYLPAQDFHVLLQSQRRMATTLVKVIARRFRHMVHLVEELSFSTVRSRLASHLLALARQQGRRVPEGIEIELKERNQQLATRLGTVRELVSRTLGRFHNEGLIRMQGRRVLIPDLQALENEARSS
jgi:CRP/FNR family transcriptional regulator